MLNILVVEDNVDLCELIASELKLQGYEVHTAFDGKAALEKYEETHIDLLITDIMLPEIDGYELVSIIRKENSSLPILIITAKSSQADKYKGFTVGTDDYMVKPLDMDELVLRVSALLRRAKIAVDKKLKVGGAELDYDTYSVTIDGKTSVLPQKEFQILFKLLSYPDKIFTRVQLMDEFWGVNSGSDEMTVYTHIHRLRDRYYDCPYFEIMTLRNLGYKAVLK